MLSVITRRAGISKCVRTFSITAHLNDWDGDRSTRRSRRDDYSSSRSKPFNSLAKKRQEVQDRWDSPNRSEGRGDRGGRGGRGGGRYNKYNDRANNNFQGSSSQRFKSSRRRVDKDEEQLIDRTLTHRMKEDGLMGLENYDVISGEELSSLKWQDLIPKEKDASVENPSGTSDVPVSQLADMKLLSRPLVNSLIHNRKYTHLTPVQAQTLLPILKGESVVVRAKTGTGKTAAFSIPLLQKVLDAKKQDPDANHVHALIVSPTRELAQQIADEIFKITSFGGLSHLKVQSLVGGLAKDRQITAAGLDGRSKVADILVATPGRLLDVLSERNVAKDYFHSLSARVFDEADRILDIGFEREMEVCREIVDEVSTKNEIPLLLFSATADRKMQQFARKQFGDRVKVVDTVPKDEPTANELVEQHAISCKSWLELFEGTTKEIVTSYEKAQEEGGHFKAIVFLPTTLMVDQYEQLLRGLFGRSSFSKNIMGVHGQRTQSSRQARSDVFRREKDAVLITTDVVARGMDFPKVTHVFQLGPPVDVSSYVHRIGRTARIGNSGKSYLYYTPHMRSYIDSLGKEGIKPNLTLYEGWDEKNAQRVQDAFERSFSDDEEVQSFLSSLMGYMTVFKAKFNMNQEEFLRDMQPFAEYLGLEEMRLSSAMNMAWRSNHRRSSGRRGFGSSRKSRMRW